MSSSLNDVRRVWESCVFFTMFHRRRCSKRPSLYYTETGTLVLDTRSMLPRDPELLSAIVLTCDIAADNYGFTRDLSVDDDNLFVWRKGGDA